MIYPADFNCAWELNKDLDREWWADQMDQHSAKVVEIERLTGMRFFQHKDISPEQSVILRTYLSEFDDFEKLLPKASALTNLANVILAFILLAISWVLTSLYF